MSTDATPIPELTERQLYILSVLIRAYTQHPEPVSSKQLVEEYDLNVSSATVRNELAILEQLGMVRSPHTSAGRIPTEEGYRYFVQHLLTDQELPAVDQKSIQEEFKNAAQDIRKWVNTAATVLARHTNAAAMVTEPRSRTAHFKHLQLISTYGHLVLMVLVLEGGDLLQQLLTLTEIVDQERLTQVAAMINDQCLGENSAGVRSKARQTTDLLVQEVMELVADVLGEAERGGSYVIHWYGFGDLLTQFEESYRAQQQALRILDEKTLINRLISEVIDDQEKPLQVIVGGDGRFDEISELSIVVGRYGTRQLAGAMSVVGPTRMRYGKAISTVRYVATLMTAMMQDVYGTED